MKDRAFVVLCLGSAVIVMIAAGYIKVAAWQECRNDHGWAFCFTTVLR